MRARLLGRLERGEGRSRCARGCSDALIEKRKGHLARRSSSYKLLRLLRSPPSPPPCTASLPLHLPYASKPSTIATINAFQAPPRPRYAQKTHRAWTQAIQYVQRQKNQYVGGDWFVLENP